MTVTIQVDELIYFKYIQTQETYEMIVWQQPSCTAKENISKKLKIIKVFKKILKIFFTHCCFRDSRPLLKWRLWCRQLNRSVKADMMHDAQKGVALK